MYARGTLLQSIELYDDVLFSLETIVAGDGWKLFAREKRYVGRV